MDVVNFLRRILHGGSRDIVIAGVLAVCYKTNSAGLGSESLAKIPRDDCPAHYKATPGDLEQVA